MLRRARGPVALAATAALMVSACSGILVRPSAPPTPARTAAAAASPPATETLGTADRPIRMAFPPSPETARATAGGETVAAALGSATGLSWEVTVPSDHAAAVEAMCAGEVDVAWLSPLGAALASQRNCGDVILGALRDDGTGRPSTTYGSQILVRSDGGITDIEGLKGKRFAFGDPASLSGRLFPAVKLADQTGEDPNTFFSGTVFADGEAEAVLALYQGRVDGAAAFIEVRTGLQATFPDIMETTRRISTAGPVPNDAISVRKGLPAALRDRIGQALVDHSRTEAGKTALKGLYGIEGFGEIDVNIFDRVLEAARVVGIDLQQEAATTPSPIPRP